MFPPEDDAEASCPDSTTSQVMMHLSLAAIVGALVPKTLCLKGEIQGVPLLFWLTLAVHILSLVRQWLSPCMAFSPCS